MKKPKGLFNSFTGYQHAFLQAGIERKLSAGNLYLFKSGWKKAMKLANETKILVKKNILCAFHCSYTSCVSFWILTSILIFTSILILLNTLSTQRPGTMNTDMAKDDNLRNSHRTGSLVLHENSHQHTQCHITSRHLWCLYPVVWEMISNPDNCSFQCRGSLLLCFTICCVCRSW